MAESLNVDVILEEDTPNIDADVESLNVDIILEEDTPSIDVDVESQAAAFSEILRNDTLIGDGIDTPLGVNTNVIATVDTLNQVLNTKQDKGDYATNTRVNQVEASIPEAYDDTEIRGLINEVEETSEQAKAIAEGKSTGYVFDTVDDMNSWLETNSSILKLGDNLYIRAVDVPDYWWDGEKAQQLETQKVDLSAYVKNTDYATANKYGVVKVTNSWGIGQNDSAGLYVMSAYEHQIDAKTSNYNPIVPSKLDYAVKVGLTTNSINLTDEEKTNAQAWLGIEGGGGGATADTSSTLVVPANYGIKAQNTSGLATSKKYYNFSSCHTVNLIQKQLSTGNIYTGVSTPVLRLQQDSNNYVEMNVTGYVLSFNLVIGGTKLRTVSFGQSDDIWKALIGAHSWVLTFDYIQRKFVIHTRGITTASNGSFIIDMSEWELDQLGNFQIVTEMGTGYTTVLGSKFLVLNSYININTYLDTKLTADNYSPFGVSYVGTQTNANNYTLKVDGTRLETISPTHVINSYNLEATTYFAMGLNGGASVGTGSVMVTKIRFNEITTETKLYEGATASRILVLDDDFKPITTLATNTAFIPEVNKWYTLVADLRRDSGYSSLYSYRLMGAGTIEVKGLFISHPQYMGLGSLNWNGEYFTGYIPFKGRAIKFEQITSMLVPPLYQQKIVDGNIQMWNGSVWKQISN